MQAAAGRRPAVRSHGSACNAPREIVSIDMCALIQGLAPALAEHKDLWVVVGGLKWGQGSWQVLLLSGLLRR